MSRIKILAIESSADETSAAVLEGHLQSRKFKLTSNIIYSQIKIHQKTGGIVPEAAARNHILKILPVIEEALSPLSSLPREGGIQGGLKSIDAIAVTAGPGLVTSLMIGVDTAKALAFAAGKPLLPINHMEGHLLSGLSIINNQLSIKFPALGLIVSGGHTMLVLVKKIGEYKILGETLDDAAGECFDKVAKILGLPYPGGPEISRLAKQGSPLAFNFPRPMINSKNYDFSFSGLKTAVLYFWRDVIARGTLRSNPGGSPRPSQNLGSRDDKLRADIAASVEQAIVDVLVKKTIDAAREYKIKSVLLGGGVSANKKLQQELAKAVKKNIPHSIFHIPHSSLTTDNAGMIAIAAFYQYCAGKAGVPITKITVNPNWELTSWN